MSGQQEGASGGGSPNEKYVEPLVEKTGLLHDFELGLISQGLYSPNSLQVRLSIYRGTAFKLTNVYLESTPA